MEMNLLNLMNPKNGKREESEGRKKSVSEIQRTKEVVFVSKYMEEFAVDILQISQKVMGLGRRPLDKTIEQENEDYHGRRFREHVSGMKTSYENSANQSRNQLPTLFKKRTELEGALEKIDQIVFIKDETGKKPWTLRDRLVFLLFAVASVALIGASASAIEAVVITGFPALSAHPIRAWLYGIGGGIVGAGSLYGIGYAISKHSQKVAQIYFLILEILGAIATIALIASIAKIGMGSGTAAVSLDFTNTSAAPSSGDSSNDFMLVFSEVLGEWIFAAICLRKAVEIFLEHGAPTTAKNNPDYPRILEQLANLNRDISDWESKLADNTALLAVISEGEKRHVQKAQVALKARYHQNRLSYGILD